MNINFPTASADGQIFKFGDLSWSWNSFKNRWESTPVNFQTIFPVSSGGTNSNVSSGALVQLGVTKENLGINFATLNDVASGVNTDLYTSSLLAVQGLLMPGFRFVSLDSMTATLSGTSSSFTAGVEFGTQVNFPSTPGYSSRTLGGSGQLMLSRNASFGRIQWNNTVMLGGRIRGLTSSITSNNKIFYWVFGEVTSDPVFGAFQDNRKAIGLRIVGAGAVELITQNGPLSSFTSVASNLRDIRLIPFDFLIMSRAGNVSLYLNNVFSVSTNNGPTGQTSTTGNTRLRISAESLSFETLNALYISNPVIYTQ
jgi:hypothetical protein